MLCARICASSTAVFEASRCLCLGGECRASREISAFPTILVSQEGPIAGSTGALGCRINTEGVIISGVKQLFRGHKELILGFNTFLPQVSRLRIRNMRFSEIWMLVRSLDRSELSLV